MTNNEMYLYIIIALLFLAGLVVFGFWLLVRHVDKKNADDYINDPDQME